MDTDQERAAKLTAMVERLTGDGSDRWAGVKSILREMEALHPGCVERMAAGIQLDKVRRLWRGSSVQ